MKATYNIVILLWVAWLVFVYRAATYAQDSATGGILEAILFWASVIFGIGSLGPLGVYVYFRRDKDA